MSISTWVSGGRVKRESMEELQRCAVDRPSFQAKETECVEAWSVKSKEFDVAKGGTQVCIEEKTVRDDKGKTGGDQIKRALAIHASEFAFHSIENGELQAC